MVRNISMIRMELYPIIQCIMMTSSNENIFRVSGHLCREFTGPRWIPHTKASDAEAGDLRRHRAHSDVIVMIYLEIWLFSTHMIL